MVYDNRFIPLLARPRLIFDGKPSSIAFDTFITTANNAVYDEKTVSIPSLFGPFDQKKFADGMVMAGYPNPLRPELRTGSLPWHTAGKIQTQGISFTFHMPIISERLSTGLSCLFMHVNTYEQFALGQTLGATSPYVLQELDNLRRLMFTQIGLTHNQKSQIGFGDIDWYIRLGHAWHYEFKCRNCDIGARVGLLIPTGKKRSLNTPSSIPFGGNGHWGMYGAIDGLFELREDLKVGLMARISTRFTKTSCQRLTVHDEPAPLGIITGLARVRPGLTFVLSPLIALENLREGLGISAQYTMTKHLQDKWNDARLDSTYNGKEVSVNLDKISELSSWASDYFTVNVFYDFGKTKISRSIEPILSFRWDIPAALYVTDSVPSTNRISIGVEFVF